jgi:hypothetical protein
MELDSPQAIEVASLKMDLLNKLRALLKRQ